LPDRQSMALALVEFPVIQILWPKFDHGHRPSNDNTTTNHGSSKSRSSILILIKSPMTTSQDPSTIKTLNQLIPRPTTVPKDDESLLIRCNIMHQNKVANNLNQSLFCVYYYLGNVGNGEDCLKKLNAVTKTSRHICFSNKIHASRLSFSKTNTMKSLHL